MDFYPYHIICKNNLLMNNRYIRGPVVICDVQFPPLILVSPQRRALRPRTASSVPLRSWWRRSCRHRACGRAVSRIKALIWESKRRRTTAAVEDTVPSSNCDDSTGLRHELRFPASERAAKVRLRPGSHLKDVHTLCLSFHFL